MVVAHLNAAGDNLSQGTKPEDGLLYNSDLRSYKSEASLPGRTG